MAMTVEQFLDKWWRGPYVGGDLLNPAIVPPSMAQMKADLEEMLSTAYDIGFKVGTGEYGVIGNDEKQI